MKKLLFVLFIAVCGITSFGQETKNRKLFTLDGNDIGGYIGVNGRFTNVNSLGAGLIDIRIAVVVNNDWAIGFNSSGLLNDRHLNTLVSDGIYHLMGSYKGIYLERIIAVNEDLRCSISLLVAQGTLKYEYCRSEIANRKWYEEVIDQNDFNLIEPTIEINYNAFDKFWVGANIGFNLTTPVRLMQTDGNILNTFNGGICIKYGLF